MINPTSFRIRRCSDVVEAASPISSTISQPMQVVRRSRSLDDSDARRVRQRLGKLGNSLEVALGRTRSLPTQFDRGHGSAYSLIDEIRIIG